MKNENMLKTTHQSFGLDVGALAVKLCVEENGKIISRYKLHKGHPENAIVELADELQTNPSCAAVTGGGGKGIAEKLGLRFVDPAVALIAGIEDPGKIRHIVDIGGASLSIVDLDEDGRFQGFRTNSLCAAGTGSFLDEQAGRMNLSLSEMSAERNVASPPRIAARCAVFAKSDLIHRQQEGFTIPEMWSGLCKGMVSTALNTLFRGRKPAGPTLVVGGVALNREVLKWLTGEIDAEIIVPQSPETFSARGLLKATRKLSSPIDWNLTLKKTDERTEPRRPRLELSLSQYPSFECPKNYFDDETQTEVRIHRDLKGDVVVGLDIGSTSTKAAVLNTAGDVAADLYRKTSGNPIEATKKIFATLVRAAGEGSFRIVGAGTTGSGRKMIGSIIGADLVLNEISAHVWGAVTHDPDVETIFEIGGQDSKFISIREGVPHDSNMNYVCAAGTGSFVEEQAGKLGFKLDEIGNSVMGTCPPYSTDRCTVFMEQDVHALIRKGFDKNEVMGSVLYSVVQNYLNRVVGRRTFSKKKICFLGATARNKGLVAAFEKLIEAPISVSPYCHVMGAYGVAKRVWDDLRLNNLKTSFAGLAAVFGEVELVRETCELCANRCAITKALVTGNSKSAPSWGYQCGRDPLEKSIRVNAHFEPFRTRERLWLTSGSVKDLPEDAPTIGIPRALMTYSHLPLWRKFFGELGIKVILSKRTHEGTLPLAEDFIGSDYCYPIKLAHGHVRELAKDDRVESVFLPYVVLGEPHDDNFKRSVYCPYNICFAAIAKQAGLTDEEGKKIIGAIVNFQYSKNTLVEKLHEAIGPVYQKDRLAISAAWDAALFEQHLFEKKLVEAGEKYLAEMQEEGRDGVVILGRPYNTSDLGANLNLPRKIADLGFTALPVEMLPLSDTVIDDRFKNMYWKLGRKILQAATLVASNPRLHAVFMTNFGCGPDSFLQTYVERIMKGKPMLMLELDEHSADAGYITRLEAFRDVIAKAGNNSRVKSAITITRKRPSKKDFDNLWLPPMHPYGAPMLAAALRSEGYPAKTLPQETLETFELAKRYCRGTECVPAPSTIGAFLGILKKSNDPARECFFMPTAKGPCRFGQYSTLHRIILDEAGYRDTPIESWDDGSGDFGLTLKTSRKCYNGIITGDLLYKARCRLRPYAADRDEFDRRMKKNFDTVVGVMEAGENLDQALRKVSKDLSSIEYIKIRKPLVGIVGEIYVRVNVFTNGNLVETIENAGGEAWMAPLGEWFQYLAYMDKILSRERGQKIGTRIKNRLKNAVMQKRDRVLTKCLEEIIADRLEPTIASTVKAGEEIFPRQFEGESILTVGRAIEFVNQGVDLIINCAPFGCMPGTLTSGIFQKLEGRHGVPIVSLFFDGEADLSHLVRTYLANLMRSQKFGRNV
jgi:predicted CoA-substrate-specific enzyme activase